MYNPLIFLCLLSIAIYLKLIFGPAITASLTFFTLCYLLFEEKTHIKTQYLLIALIIIMTIVIASPLIPGFTTRVVSLNHVLLIYVPMAFLYRLPLKLKTLLKLRVTLNAFNIYVIISILLYSAIQRIPPIIVPQFYSSWIMLITYTLCMEVILRLLLLNILIRYHTNTYIAIASTCFIAFVILIGQNLPLPLAYFLVAYHFAFGLVYSASLRVESSFLLHLITNIAIANSL